MTPFCLFQLVSAMVAVLPSIGAGTAMAFSSIAASQYRTANVTSLAEPLTDDESSWFGKFPGLRFTLLYYKFDPDE